MATKDLVNIITFTRTERDIHNFDIITGQGFNNAIIYSFLSLFFIILIMKAKEMYYFSNLFDKVIYMFRTSRILYKINLRNSASRWL